MRDKFEDAASYNRATVARLGPGAFDDVILEKSLEDVDKGFAAPPIPCRSGSPWF